MGEKTIRTLLAIIFSSFLIGHFTAHGVLKSAKIKMIEREGCKNDDCSKRRYMVRARVLDCKYYRWWRENRKMTYLIHGWKGDTEDKFLENGGTEPFPPVLPNYIMLMKEQIDTAESNWSWTVCPLIFKDHAGFMGGGDREKLFPGFFWEGIVEPLHPTKE